ncbi:MAG: hypothetical protein KDD38_02375 [Bdellovibrionales bacterium]|nr:hypothetical protein [Bdellovibrionales bacterium]
MKYSICAFLAVLFMHSPLMAADLCDEHAAQQEVCYKMNNLRAQIHALDAQRELMQVNPSYYEAFGHSLARSARGILKIIQPGIPEHFMGLSEVARQGNELAKTAIQDDASGMVVTANLIKNNCATCHSGRSSANGNSWDRIFKNDWSVISKRCNEPGRNPYLCKSMNGILSAYSVQGTAPNAKIQDYEMTQKTSEEIGRILVDLKDKNFKHFDSKIRDAAEATAAEVALLASQKNPLAFERSKDLLSTCAQCHQVTSGTGDPRIRPDWFAYR